jgi:ribonuclease BN (tRNA processing enzyme)
MTDHIKAAYERDIEERIFGLERANRVGHRVEVHEIEPGIIHEDSNVEVEAFPVRHGSWQSFGYKFHIQNRSIVVSGDTAPAESIIEKGRSCNVLIHEVYSAEGFNDLPSDWKSYHASMHTSSRELGEIASATKPGLLILYHQIFFGMSEEALLSEVQDRYDGRVVSGKDLEVFRI